MEEYVPLFRAYVPWFQTVTWGGLNLIAGVVFRGKLHDLLTDIGIRIRKGSSLKLGPIEIGEDLRSLPEIAPASIAPAAAAEVHSTEASWSEERDNIYEGNRRVFLAHVLEPTDAPGQRYKVFIFLVRHRGEALRDVAFAEFFLGSSWGNRIFREYPRDGKIGLATAAYGTFLCVCHVHFRDGRVAKLHRYIDFEMGRAFQDTGK